MHKARAATVTGAVLAVLLTLAGCAPLVVGGAVAVVADEAIEQDQGGDGLF